ncbi:G5 and 3D domain-containing protein [uncultured Metabacillus sp.]|uniref:G5 and 3D domain-containing protein n=1 Tax=uncultured Metabacillus sp. TaxID=2860135 RepID=UPI0026084DF6|nr:G5 and 3D domain-containing protein [uncultured Metabacillus sp.]
MKKLFSERVIKSKVVLSTASILVLGSGVAYGTYEGSKNTVALNVNGKEEKIRTHADTVGTLLKELDIDYRQEDHISPAANKRIEGNMEIVYEASKPVKLAIGEKRRTIWTTADTVKELIEQENLDVTEHDKIEPALDKKIEKNLSLTIDKAFKLALNVGDQKQQVWTTSTTVADFLKEHNIKLNKLDEVKPALTEKIDAKSTITVTRIEKVTDVVEEPIAFNVVTKKDSSLEKGEQKIIESGKEGKQKKHFEVVIKNGKEFSRKLLKTETVEESEARVVALGTKAVQPVSTATVSRGNDSVAKEFYVRSTAYTAYCNGCSGTTATGLNLRANPNAKVIAVDPSVIPLGTKVYVEGYGYAVAADTGSAIKGNKIDVFISSKSAAYRWGSKRVKIKILN